MMRLFRWNYIAPRLAILFAVLCLAELGAGWFVKQTVRSSGQSLVGARVDVARSKASLLATWVKMSGVQVADPNRPMTNLVEADAVELDLDAASLLRKKTVITRGAIRGLRFGGSRVASGALPDVDTTETLASAEWAAAEWVPDAAADRAEAWLDQLGDRFSADLQDQFESVRVARVMREKWPARYDELTAAANQIHQEAKMLTDQVAAARENPLRHAAFLRSAPQRVTALNGQLRQLYAELEALPGQVQADRQAIADARRHDEQLIRQSLAIEQLDAASLSAYLLGEEIAAPMGELIAWLKWLRQMAPSRSKAEPTQRSRGVDVLFAGITQRPDLLIKTLDLSGTARVGGRPVDLAGTLTDFTTEPHIIGRPMQLQLSTTGSLPARLKATIDRTGPEPRDELLANCNGIAMPQMQLGGDEWLGLEVEPSNASISVSLLLEGDRLSGDVQLVQKQIRMTPHIASGGTLAAAAPLREALTTNLERLPTIATRVDLSGSLDSPQWSIWSNLGPAVAQAVESAVASSIDGHTQELMTASDREVEAQLAQFEQELTAARARVESALGEPSNAIRELVAQLPGAGPSRRFGNLGLDSLIK